MKIILFDGVCNLCNRAVRFVIRHDPAARFHFAPLQSETGQRLLREAGMTGELPDSVVYLRDGRPYFRSSAILHILRDIGGGWRVLYGFIIIPPFIRDAVYRLLAFVRLRVGGKHNSCALPTSTDRARFL